MIDHAEVFRQPTRRAHIRYEALRAYYVDGLSARQAADKFGYTYGSFKNLCMAFRRNPTDDFFWPRPKPLPPTTKSPDPRPERIVALRKQHNASIYQIVELLKAERLTASSAYVYKVLVAAGFKKTAPTECR